jgi:cell division transport system permease protein
MENKTSFKTKLRRTIKSGFVNFFRSGYVSLASVLIMVITLSVIASVIFMGAILDTTLDELRNKVDVNVYFLTSAEEPDILALKDRLSGLPEVSNIEYISREAALENFKKRHENDQITLQALEELGDNPLGAALNIKAKNPSQYQGISDFLGEENILSKDGKQIIDKVNYLQNKTAIDRLTKIIDSSEKMGMAITIVLIAVSLAITLNTIRLAIFISRDEISVMQLVGASKNYIRGPFVITGVMYGIVAALITLVLFIPVTYWLGGLTQNFFIGLNIFDYYLGNFFEVFFLVMGAGVGIGALSSLMAVRKYLKL